MRFEWDEEKNRKNIEKHAIDFSDAAKIFGEIRITKRSDRRGEKRWITTGIVNTRIITVVYTIRDRNVRIISARKANKHEKKTYHSI